MSLHICTVLSRHNGHKRILRSQLIEKEFYVSVTGLPFDDIRALLKDLPKADEDARGLSVERNEALNIKFGKLGKQAELTQWLAAWSGKSPIVTRPLMALFAGTHKIESQLIKGPSANEESTLDVVTRLASGGAPANQACAAGDIGLKVFDLALQYPVEDILVDEAMDEKGSAATIGFGMEAIAGGVDVLGFSGFGKGAHIASAAILALLLNKHVEDFISHEDTESIKLAKIAMTKHESAKGNALEVLRCLGGREHSALAGGILAARTNHIPVILDGLVAWAVVAVLEDEKAGACNHCISANKHSILSNALGIAYVFEDGASFNDGSTCAQAIAYLKSCADIHTNSVLNIEEG